jgi:hypothetical protein
MRCKNKNYRQTILVILVLSLAGLSSNAIAECSACPGGEGCGWTFDGDSSIPLTKGNGNVPATLDITQDGTDLLFTFDIVEVGGVQPQLWVGTNPADFSTSGYTYKGNTEYRVPLSTFGECTDSQQLTIYVRALYNGGMTDKDGDKFVEETLVCECCECPPECYCPETAWAYGPEYADGGQWATYFENDLTSGTSVPIYAGQNILVGTADTTPPSIDGKVTITITLDGDVDAVFADASENVKIQGYWTAPDKEPVPGHFDTKMTATAGGISFSTQVDAYPFYGIHLDVGIPCACPP